MGAGHGHRWFVHGHSPVHELAPEAKVAATVLFVLAVVVTPREAFWAIGLYVAIIVAVALVAAVQATLVSLLSFGLLGLESGHRPVWVVAMAAWFQLLMRLQSKYDWAISAQYSAWLPPA